MSIRRGTLATLGTIRPEILIALLAATVGTNLLDFATAPSPGTPIGATFVTAAVVRILLVFWVGYAVQRSLAGGGRPFRPSTALTRFSVLQVLLLIGFGLATRLGTILQGPGEVPLATQWLFGFLAMAFYALFAIRLLAWNAALAMGEPFARLVPLWRAQGGHVVAIGGAYVSLILPITAIHLAMTLVALKIEMTVNARLGVAIVDGLLQAIELGLTCALGVIAWRIATAIEAAPPPHRS